MTCGDAIDLCGRHPADWTTAERSAWLRHVPDCPACQAWVTAKCEEAERNGVAVEGFTEADAVLLIRSDSTDPEATR